MDAANAVVSVSGAADGAAYALSQSDVTNMFQMLWMVEITQIFQFVALVLIIGLIFGLILTRKWSV